MAKKRKSSDLSKPVAKKTKVDRASGSEDESIPERVSSLWKVGAHVSSAGGVENAIINASEIGANAFAMFVKSQRKWSSPPLSQSNIDNFKQNLLKYNYNPRYVLPHGSYLINLGNPDVEKRRKSYDCFLDDLKRCEQLGLELYNFHPGSTVGETTTENSISLIAKSINSAHAATNTVITVVENMAGAGNIIGSTFDQIASIIDQVEDKGRIGVCLDTCHLFAAGYDIRTKETWEKTMSDFDKTVGLRYLKGMHLNDSKSSLASKKDRHENVGLGCLGIEAFFHIVRDTRMQNLPLILETPSFEQPTVWAKEIEVLNNLSNSQDEEYDSLADAIKASVKEAEARSKKKKSGSKMKQE